MERPRDPVERADDEGRDLYDVASWERRTLLDKFAALLYQLLHIAARVGVVLLAAAILVAQFVLGGLSAAATDPTVVTLVPLSAVPALALAAYVWRADVTTSEPLSLLVVTFVLGVLFATFAGIVNSAFQVVFGLLGAVGLPLFFYLVVAPVEETVKLLAVRLHAFRSDRFDSVVDGAVYGATAGLGFATIENYLYISRGFDAAGADAAMVGAVGGLAAVRALAGPGHVIYSAIAGYYLGLAKYNPEDAGPIVVKGLLVASFVHATYNTLVGVVPPLLDALVVWAGEPFGYVAFVLVYDGLWGYYLYRKLDGYARAYRRATATGDVPETEGAATGTTDDVREPGTGARRPEGTEFED